MPSVTTTHGYNFGNGLSVGVDIWRFSLNLGLDFHNCTYVNQDYFEDSAYDMNIYSLNDIGLYFGFAYHF